MPKFALVGLIATVVAVYSLAGAPANARPLYNEAYKKKHPENADQKCAACHMGKPAGKMWNNYGIAFGRALGRPDVKDLNAINRAIDTADKGK